MTTPNNVIQVKTVIIITPEIAAYIKRYDDLTHAALPAAIQNLTDTQFAAMAKMGILPGGYGSIQDALDATENWEDWPAIDNLYSVEQFQGTIQTIPNIMPITRMNRSVTSPEHIAYIVPENTRPDDIETEFKNLFADKQYFDILPDDFDFRQHIVNISGTRKPAGVWHGGQWFPC